MTVLRRCVMLTVLLLAVATGAGCGSGRSPGPVPGVTGRFGADPLITIPGGHPSSSLIVQTVIPGRGPVVQSDDYVLFNVEGKVWAGDREVVDSYTDRQPQGLPLQSGLPAWRHLAGQRVGSRVLMVVPPQYGFGRKGDPQANIMSTDTLVFVFDLLGAMPQHGRAAGTVLPYQPGTALPGVTEGGHGPVISIPAKTSPPGKLVRQVLIRGHGKPLQTGQTVVVQDTGVVWRTGKVFDSTWTRGFPESFVLGSGQVLPGWDTGLRGLPVGSRVLLILPPKLGYGQAGNPPDVGAHDTLVFVIDILAAV
jgi:FKBP-type peptidyl-prolyl cis-trans isomerase